MRSRYVRLLVVLAAFILFFCAPADAQIGRLNLVDEVLPVDQIRPGMRGRAFTVIKGDKVESFPVSIVSVIPRKGTPHNLIMIRAEGTLVDRVGGIAAGMSGSPVYVGDKLIGAIGYGWPFSDHKLGLVTPIEDMASIWNWPEEIPFLQAAEVVLLSADKGTGNDRILSQQEKALPLLADGLSNRSITLIEKVLGKPVTLLGGSSTGELPVEYDPEVEPGDAVGVLLAWGDITLGATGTLTAISDDGRFIAFAHPFMNRGNVAYPLTRAWIHDVVPSIASPFKIGSPRQIIGIVTQDRPQAIGGRLGIFAPSVDVSVEFSDTDAGVKQNGRFHVAYDPFMLSKLAPGLFLGFVDSLWQRSGQGTAKFSLEIEGGNLVNGWNYDNIFFSDSDIVDTVSKEFAELLNVFVLNPFQEISPLGVHARLEVTKAPRALYIEDFNLDKKSYSPGQKVKLEVFLRPYRRERVKKTFELTIPKDAIGPCQVIVRGGGIAGPNQEGSLGSEKPVISFQQLLKELDAKETNDEVIVELSCQKSLDDRSTMEAMLTEDPELWSEVRNRRMKEGALRIFKSDYYVEGLLQKTIIVRSQNGELKGN